MGRKVDVDDLVSAIEIAERLHLENAGLVNSWRRRYTDFPKPIVRLRIGNLYSVKDIEAGRRRARAPELHRSAAPAPLPPRLTEFS